MSQISQFKNFMSKQKPTAFFFLSENQETYSVADPCNMELTFKNMLISENPSTICLVDGEGSILRFNMVKKVEYEENRTALGFVIKIVCGLRGTRDADRSYTLIAS